MKRLSKNLWLLLAAQVIVVTWVFWPQAEQGAVDASKALLAGNSDTISRAVISDSENSVVLHKGDSAWHLPEYHNLPVDPAKLTRLLDALPALPRGFPVARTSGAKQRFEVASDNYQRRVQYSDAADADGGVTAALYLGTSPGFRKVHVRAGEEDEVYAVEFNVFDLPTTAAEWLDATLLQVKEVQTVQGLDYTVSRQADSWLNDTGEVAATDTADKLINGLQNLRVSGAADPATAKILSETAAPPTLTVTAAGSNYEYHLYAIAEAYYIKRSDIPIYFSISAYDHDRLNDVSAATLFQVAEDQPATSGEENPSPDP